MFGKMWNIFQPRHEFESTIWLELRKTVWRDDSSDPNFGGPTKCFYQKNTEMAKKKKELVVLIY